MRIVVRRRRSGYNTDDRNLGRGSYPGVERLGSASPARTDQDKSKSDQASARSVRPQYRLRVDEMRVFYDVELGRVEILAIVMKSDVAA
jgi:hypothetical protein